MKRLALLFIVMSTVLLGTCVYVEAFDFDSVIDKYFDYYMEENNTSNEYAYQNYVSMNSDGSFSNVDYNSGISTAWTHLRNLITISVSANKSGTKVNNVKSDAMAKVEAGIAYWHKITGDPFNEDGTLKHLQEWWNYTIGQQLLIMPILVITDGDISAESQEILMGYLYNSEDMKNYPGFLTAANLIWYENEGIIESLIRRDFDGLKKSFETIISDAKVRTDIYAEGIQSDGSFHQHGADFYPGYAVNYILHISNHLKMMSGTELEKKDIYPIISKTILDGFRWITRGKYMNLNLYGRQISDKVSKEPDVSGYIRSARNMAEIYPYEADKLNEFADYLEGGKDNTVPVYGNRYFYRSDMLVQNRGEYSLNYRMVSDRTISGECNGTQNIYGSYIGFGTSFLEKEGDSHYGYPVFMDWAKLPGTTTPDYVDKILYSGTMISQREKFVGGVSDGEYGACAMQMSAFQTKAKKACFAFDDEIVYLGSDITSSGKSVNTSVEQRFKYSDVTADGKKINDGEWLINNASCITQNNISYVFPQKTDVCVKSGAVKGKWSDIGSSTDTTEYSADCFSLWIPHGGTPVNAEYSYIVLPNCSAEAASEYVNNMPVSIIANTDKLQAVYNKNLNIGYAVFYKEGICKFSNEYSVQVTKPCILMLRSINNEIVISISNPVQKPEEIDAVLLHDGISVKKTYNMLGNSYSEGAMGGSTISKVF
ncbi:MAG: hypothetical protein J6N52_13245 [Clostridia bacterium]|nr:hypothetical protein [Clostridia bacterium]